MDDEKIVGLSALIGNGMGVMIVTMAQRMALREGAVQRTKDTWEILDKWLGLDGKEFGPELHSKVNKAYDAYLAIGIAPSTTLQPMFDEASQDLKSESYNLRPHKPPPEVIRAFDRMVATDEAIKAKREVDRPDKPKPDSSWPKTPDDPLTKSVQRLSARVTSLELEAAREAMLWLTIPSPDLYEVCEMAEVEAECVLDSREKLEAGTLTQFKTWTFQ